MRNLVPDFIKEYLLLMKQRAKYPNCSIYSYAIGENCILGYSAGVMKSAVLHSNCELGDYSYINSNTVIGYARIGKYSSIGYNCQIGMHNHPIDFMSTSPFTYGENNVFNVEKYYKEMGQITVIGNDCWIASNSVVLQGVNIGDGAVVAAGSVVTKDVEPYSVVAGVPAKEIKKRFDQNKIEYLMNIKWWNFEAEELEKYRIMFLKKENWFQFSDNL